MVGGVIGMVAAMFLPYKALVNILYGLNGYLGFILVGFMIVYDIRTRMGSESARPRATMRSSSTIFARRGASPDLSSITSKLLFAIRPSPT